MKLITETFSIELPDKNSTKVTKFHIEARNYNEHRVNFGGQESICLSLANMYVLGNHLIDTAHKIDNDPVFQSK